MQVPVPSIDVPGCYGCSTPFPAFQTWLSHHLHGHAWASNFMSTKYGWHACETLHFIGLSMLIGAIGMFDLRVLGIGKRIPIAPLHRLAPFAVAGFLLNAVTGMMFLMTFPNQYIYQWPFWVKLLFIAIAATNALIFNLFVMRKVEPLGPGADAPVYAKVMCATSLSLWIAVIFLGRFLAFYKPDFTLPVP
jgi:hypothetical protein